MNKTVCVMDVDLSLLDKKGLEGRVREYLSNDSLNVILLATEKLLLWAAERPEFRDSLLRADLILPGEEALLSQPGEQVLSPGSDMVVNYKCLETLLIVLKEEKKTIYVVTDQKEHIYSIERFLRKYQSKMVLCGSAIKSETTDESMINEINSIAPDVLLADFSVPEQEEWLMTYSTQLNARLCIGLGGIMNRMIAEYKEEPRLVSKLRLSGIYNTLIRKNHYKKAKKERSFRQKLQEYGDKCKRNEDENTGK